MRGLATRSPRRRMVRRVPCRATGRASPWSSPGYFRPTPRGSATSRRPSRSSSSMTVRSHSSPRTPRPLGLDFDAGSSAFSTSRSSRNDSSVIESIAEPFVNLSIIVPSNFVGPMMELCQERRGVYKRLEHKPGDRVVIEYEMPLGEIIHDFYDQLKSRSKGYASMDYEMIGFREGDLVKLDVLVAGEPVDALSLIVHRSKASIQGRKLVEKLKTIIPRQMFIVPLQAAIGGKVVARETIPAMRKDVLAKCYGGDITRKRKLLEKQKEGKRRMKRVGSIEIPQEAFMAVLKLD